MLIIWIQYIFYWSVIFFQFIYIYLITWIASAIYKENELNMNSLFNFIYIEKVKLKDVEEESKNCKEDLLNL